MANRKKSWEPSPSRRAKPKVPQSVKAEVERKGHELVEYVLKPKHITPPPDDSDFNYLADMYTKWYRNYFYFYAKYHCPSPHAISPEFETGFARLEYVGDDVFNLSYMRHTGQWWEIYSGLSLAECLATIEEEPHFIP
ncbi:hypothetical protein C2W62_04355 [Candidatus Entotheonella serta]|nr:hypothetical protein C2W62_04355 [Candidatus Entotheonella serta]